jgi:hypothetical protein
MSVGSVYVAKSRVLARLREAIARLEMGESSPRGLMHDPANNLP